MRMRMVAYFFCISHWLIGVTGTSGQNRDTAARPVADVFAAATLDVVYKQENATGITTVTLDSSNLPILVINTNGKTIPDGTKITARMKVINHGPGKVNRPIDPDAEYDGYIGIEIRGRFSTYFPQKPYGLETRDSLGNNLNVSLLGMPKENDWILIPNYNEKSLVRSTLSFDLFRRMGHYAPRARLCEVILNSQYRGIYVFSEKIKPDQNRVVIAKLKPEDDAGNALTGGYIISVDYYGSNDNWISSYPPFYYPNRRVHYNYVYPKPDEIIPAQKKYIQNFIKAAEGSVYGASFTDPSVGYHRYVNVPSFIDYFIVSEVSRNVDGYKKSRFFFKNRNDKDSLLYAGPVWDFDWAWKNITEGIFGNTDGSGWGYKTNDYNPSYAVPDWHIRLLQDGQFTNLLIERYQALRSDLLHLNTINQYIDSVKTVVDDAQKRHFALWPISGPNPAPEVEPPAKSYAEEIARLKEWIRKRIVWLDVNMPALRANIIQKYDTTNISIVNASFEQPGIGKVTGWDGSCANPNWTGLLYDIPGWSSDVPAFDSGVEQGYGATDGTWTAFLMGSDSSIYQITNHIIDAEENFELTVDSKDNYNASLLNMKLFYVDFPVQITLVSKEAPISGSMTAYSISFAAPDYPAAIGHNLGISFKNASPIAQSWLALDMVKLVDLTPTVVNEMQGNPTAFSLAQNFPNPFNQQTTIFYSVLQVSAVTLKVYDLLGREVVVPVNNERKTAGDYKILFDAGNLPSGVYFYRLCARNFSETKKMLLLR